MPLTFAVFCSPYFSLAFKPFKSRERHFFAELCSINIHQPIELELFKPFTDWGSLHISIKKMFLIWFGPEFLWVAS